MPATRTPAANAWFDYKAFNDLVDPGRSLTAAQKARMLDVPGSQLSRYARHLLPAHSAFIARVALLIGSSKVGRCFTFGDKPTAPHETTEAVPVALKAA